MSRLHCGILLLAAFCHLSAPAQNGAKTFTLSRAMSQAAQRHKTAELAESDVRIARTRSELASEKKLPDLKFKADYSRITDMIEWQSDFSSAAIYPTIPELYDASLSFAMPVFEGNRLNNAKALSELESRRAEIGLAKTRSGLRLRTASRFLSLYSSGRRRPIRTAFPMPRR